MSDLSEQKHRLLIIDDDPHIHPLLINFLEEGYEINSVLSGQEAIEHLKTGPKPDLILLDIMMPDADGYEVCQQLKLNPDTQDIPIIFLTALNEEKNEEKGFALGAVDYISKPSSHAIIKARIKSQIELQQHKQALGELVNQRTRELKKVNRELHEDIVIRKQIEEELQAAKATFHSIVEDSLDGIIVYLPD